MPEPMYVCKEIRVAKGGYIVVLDDDGEDTEYVCKSWKEVVETLESARDAYDELDLPAEDSPATHA
jgi:hypothetical protein